MLGEGRARFHSVDLLCPNCGSVRRYTRGLRQWRIRCLDCNTSYMVGMVLYPVVPHQGKRLLPPADALFPRVQVGKPWRSGEKVHRVVRDGEE